MAGTQIINRATDGSDPRPGRGEDPGGVRAGASDENRTPISDGVGVGVVPVAAGVALIMGAYGEIFIDAVIPVVVAVGLGVWAMMRPARTPRIALAVLLTLLVGVNLVYAIPDLMHPESALPFIGTVAVIGGGTVTIVLAILAARRRPADGLVVWTIAGVVFGIASGGSLLAASAVENDAIRARDTSITAVDVEFPDLVEVAADSTALAVRNEDYVRHTLAIEGVDRVVELPARSTKRVELNLAPGEYRYFCDITGHEDMEGTLVISS